MLKGFLIVALIWCNFSVGQERYTLGVETGIQFPHLAVPFRFQYLVTDRLEIGMGLDVNSVRTIGRNIGLRYHFYRFPDLNGSFLAGLEYDNTTSGIYSFYYEQTNLDGTITIPRNQYVTPILGFRAFGKNNNKYNCYKGISYSILLSYKIPISYDEVFYRSGDVSLLAEENLTRFTDGGLNFSLRIGWWIGSK